ncbi:MAG: FHA domain-containing protein [Chloroflexi bacterium]|jgi:hypothetical protein|nr:MAG: FHA domain protein [Chloroflexi bacterium OLB13]MBC6955834.1 FHA domain-containing protein [Chloroflexota bacterium]MBV6436035.1 hypothetical protein [Anaerolineae bacterium]MDL1916478.1 FHA domain-containing protein [Anaerolineae bacterium CFX4]OQY80789.1 MAG: hypothetical protein B6D42_12370 [Anaerolineae bacterium UTCFX5]
MNDYITMMISSDQFDDKPNHNVEVLADVPIKTIIYEIQKEFQLKGAFALWTRNGKQELDANRTLRELNISKGAELEFGRRAMRIPPGAEEITGTQRGVLKVEGTTRSFMLAWQPALIGRSTDAASAAQLAIDLRDLDSNKTVSRQHARINEAEGEYLIQRVAENNQLIVDNKPLGYLAPVPLKPGSVIKLGNVSLVFQIEEIADELLV